MFSQQLPTIVVLSLVVAFVLFAVITRRSFLPWSIDNAVRFCWNCFLKPHTGDRALNQQDALESFYKAQASIYDATRTRLLRGREDMLGLVAAQVKQRVGSGSLPKKPVWVDVGCLITDHYNTQH